ncbi:hypothetical protein KGA66_18820 [Actinocrinis puniceicyclus]|uniref:Uncharacterized protein n=1 Tax=Actinocrinis puniceicyclus TaxID=977794 RepID=A0A8J7WSD0_9ACTN|nr:hypothetical protein [Actinocrinis puniceicyclus]MBS2965117.1 hypothetical protein [Actinocrinis puniceicyclus]
MGGIVGLALVITCFYGMVAVHVWIAVRTWRNPNRFGRTAEILSFRVGESVGRGLARGVAVVAGALVCGGCVILSGAVGMASPNPEVWKWVAGAFLVAFVAAVPLLIVIVVFNRPRFLVVPYMRHLNRAAIRGGSSSLRERLSGLRRAGRSDSSG